MSKTGLSKAIFHVNKAGALLVFPTKNKSDMPSLWARFFPNKKMTWDWSEEGDSDIATIWHLRSALAVSNKVVYSKWFKNRATIFSIELFTALLSFVSHSSLEGLQLSQDAKSLMQILNDDSPLATRELKKISELEGPENSARFERALKQLWQRFLIVGYGEVEEGGFPSLAVGSSKLLFEEAWDESKSLSFAQRHKTISKYFLPRSEFYLNFLKLEKSLLKSDTGK